MDRPVELAWSNKDRLLLGIGADGTPIWGGPADLVPRRLSTVMEVGRTGRPGGDNMLIQGDNLAALRALETGFAGKIACVCIDPPFNTGNAFQHYPDSLDDSLWLSMMKPRLEALRSLLREDGLIVVHIDHRELAQLKLLMDEVFGKGNLISIITLKVKDAAGVGQQSMVFDVCEYLLVYGRDISKFRPHHPVRKGELVPVDGFVKGYNKAIVDFGDPQLVDTVHRSRVGQIRIYRCPGNKVRRFKKGDSLEDYLLNFDRVFADYNPSGGTIVKIKEHIPPLSLSFMEYTPSKGRHAGGMTRVYFLNRRTISWLKDIAELDGSGRIMRKMKMTNIWDVSNAQLHSEGGIEFRLGKKPEALIERIIGIATEPGDWVLDSFLGSGTTAAVAHKMGRHWIGIEIGTHAETHALPRLKRVVSGEDRTGVSGGTRWKGGGGFLYRILL
jgi:adenine-specific DNA-methyltransferase